MFDCDDCPGCPTVATTCGGVNVRQGDPSSHRLKDSLDFGAQFYLMEVEKHGWIIRRPEGGEQPPRGCRAVMDHWGAKMSKQRNR